jgi:hypothetical protein
LDTPDWTSMNSSFETSSRLSPRRLALRADIDAAIEAGRDAALANPALRAHLRERASTR